MGGIEALFLDFGGTLAFEGMSHEESFHAFLANHGVIATRDEVQAGIRAMEAYGAAWQTGEGRTRSKTFADRYWFNVCLCFARHITSVTDSHDLAEVLHASHEIIPYTLYPDTIPALERLSAQGLTLGIISNWDAPTLDFAVRDLGIRTYFRVVLSSRCAECEKPKPGIFLEACRRAGVRPCDCVHVGDNTVADVEGARSVGMTPIWINRDHLPSWPECTVIHTLTDLPDMFDNEPQRNAHA